MQIIDQQLKNDLDTNSKKEVPQNSDITSWLEDEATELITEVNDLELPELSKPHENQQ